MELSASRFVKRFGHQKTHSLSRSPKSLLLGKKGRRRDGRCPSALLHTGETAAAGLYLLGHSSEADGLLRSVFIATVLTLEKLTVGQC